MGLLLPVSAKTASVVVTKVKQVQRELISSDLGWLLQQYHQKFDSTDSHRLIVVGNSAQDLLAKLQKSLQRLGTGSPFSLKEGVFYGVGRMTGKLAFIFPGQGSQHLFMGQDFFQTFRLQTWSYVDSLQLSPQSLQSIVYPKHGEEADNMAVLTQTQWAQPAIGIMSLGMLEVLQKLRIQPDLVAGHSYGELTALHCAGVISREDFVRLSFLRGAVMAEAAQIPGTMTAVKVSLEKLHKMQTSWNTDVVIANHNSPQQVVLSGSVEQISKVEKLLAQEHIPAQRLEVGTAFHSPIVSGAVQAFADKMTDFSFARPHTQVFANQTAALYPQDPVVIKKQLAQQIGSSVRFVSMIEAMYAAGARIFVEVGPGNTLSRLVKRILGRSKESKIIPLHTVKNQDNFQFFRAIAQLAALGVVMDCSNFGQQQVFMDSTGEKDESQ